MVALLEISVFLQGQIILIKRFLVRLSCQFVLHSSFIVGEKSTIVPLFYIILFYYPSFIWEGGRKPCLYSEAQILA